MIEKVQIKDLRQRNIKLSEELESYKHQYMTTKAKGDTTKTTIRKKSYQYRKKK